MSISNRFSPRPLSTAEPTQTGSAANIGPSASAIPVAKARGGRSSFAEKLGGFHADALSAGLRLFSDPSVKNAMAFVKSAVTSLSGTVASAYNAFSGGASQAAPRPGGQVPQHVVTIDSSAFDKWVSDNKFDGAKPTPAKTADDAALRTRVSLPPTQPGSASAKLPPLIDIGAPALPLPQQPAKAAAQQPAPAAAQGLPTPASPQPEPQVPPRTIAQDPGFAAAFDKWVQDNGFEGAKPTPAKPATGNTVHTPVTQPTTRPTAPLAPLVDIDPPVSPPPQQPEKAAQQQAPATSAAPQLRPTPVSVRARPQQQASATSPAPRPRPTPVSVRTRPQQQGAATSPARQERPTTPVSVQIRPEQHAPVTTAQIRQEPASPPDSPTAALLNRKQELNSSQSELLGLMSQIGNIKPSKEKTSASADTISARTQTEPVATKPTRVEPQAEVFTDPVAYRKATDKWDRDNHFDYDNPMPAGHVSEPRPEFKSSSLRIDTGPALPSPSEVKAQRQAELDAHQAAIDAGY